MFISSMISTVSCHNVMNRVWGHHLRKGACTGKTVVEYEGKYYKVSY